MGLRIHLGRKEYRLLCLNDWQSPCNYRHTRWYPVCFSLLPPVGMHPVCFYLQFPAPSPPSTLEQRRELLKPVLIPSSYTNHCLLLYGVCSWIFWSWRIAVFFRRWDHLVFLCLSVSPSSSLGREIPNLSPWSFICQYQIFFALLEIPSWNTLSFYSLLGTQCEEETNHAKRGPTTDPLNGDDQPKQQEYSFLCHRPKNKARKRKSCGNYAKAVSIYELDSPEYSCCEVVTKKAL